MTSYSVKTYTRSIFDDDFEDDSIDDFCDDSLSVTDVCSKQADMFVTLIDNGIAVVDDSYHMLGDAQIRVGYRAVIDDNDLNIIRVNLVHIIAQGSRNLKAYNIEVKAMPETSTLYISIMPYMPFFTTILDMYDANKAQQIDALMQQTIDTLDKGWLFKRLMNNNES